MKYTDSTKEAVLVRLAIIMSLIFIGVVAVRFTDIKGGLFADFIEYETTSGLIVSSVPKMKFHIEYVFEVKGEKYTNNKVNFGPSKLRGLEEAKALVSKYPVGKQVVVYYQKGNPDFAVLQPMVNSNHAFFIGLMAISCFFGWLIYAMVSLKKSQK